MSASYPHLLTPLRLGPATVRNRVVFSAHLTNYATDGLPTARHAAYYGARARGGAGLVITEEQSTDPADRPYEKLIRGFDPAVVPGYRRITEAVHRHGALVLAQLNHNGPQSSGLYTRLPVLGPSPVPDPHFREVPKEAEADELASLVDGYATVAAHCVEGGFDGVEIQCSQSSILRCFLAPGLNRRTDRYGGTIAGRARLLLEVVAAVRRTVGRGVVVGVRLCGDELVDGGTTIDDAVAVARLVEAQGDVDYLNTTVGVATASLAMVEPSMRVPAGYALHVPSALRRAVGLPVVGVGRFTDPSQAEHAIAGGHCDLVGVVRGQIADPEFVAAARNGRTGATRRCLGCNQECVARVGRNRWLGCVVNPSAGREAAPAGQDEGGRDRQDEGGRDRQDGAGAARIGGPARRSVRERRVVVVGAGPAGLRAAVTAAGAGHRVTVLEADAEPGGAVRLAALAPGRAGMGDLVAGLVGEVRSAGVDLRLGVTADVDAVVALEPGAVVVATGARPDRPAWAPAEGTRVVDVTDVLAGRARPVGRVVVVDGIGFHHATSVAELLAGRGCTVTVTTDGMVVGQDLDGTLDLEHWLRAAAAAGIVERTDLVPVALTPHGLTLLHHPTATTVELGADAVVLALPGRPADGLYHQLRSVPGLEVHRAGDCVAPRRAHAAVIEGERVAAML